MANILDPVRNFAIVTLSSGYNDVATSVVLVGGDGAKLPAPSTDGSFNMVWWNATDYANPSDDPNKEIVRVTARSTDTLTITRAQEGTSATTKNTAGKTYKMILAYTKEQRDKFETWALNEHNPDGTHKLAAITSAMQTWDGWVALGACTYETADAPTFQFSIASDVTGLLAPGMRIKLTQTTAKYFIVTAVGAFTGGKTIITVYGGTDYTLANAAITTPYFSALKAPLGFPLNPLKWTVEAVTAGGIQVSPAASTWYNKGGSLVVPIGAWKLSYAATIFAYGQVVTGNSQITAYSTLSKSASTEDDSSFTCNIDGVCYMAAFGQLLRSAVSAEKAVLLASKTTYYANCLVVQSSTQQVGLSPTSTIIRAICAYL